MKRCMLLLSLCLATNALAQEADLRGSLTTLACRQSLKNKTGRMEMVYLPDRKILRVNFFNPDNEETSQDYSLATAYKTADGYVFGIQISPPQAPTGFTNIFSEGFLIHVNEASGVSNLYRTYGKMDLRFVYDVLNSQDPKDLNTCLVSL